jgi:hypothetical protein
MATLIPPPVQSGDVIQADFVNKIIQALSDIDARLRNLETGTLPGTGTPSINPLSQTSLHVNDQIILTGQNLWAAGLNSVFLEVDSTSTRISQFLTATDTQLVFTIPTVAVNPGGSAALLRVVSPTHGSGTVNFTLLPAAVTIPTGQLLVSLAGPSGSVATGSNTFSYTITATTTLADTYDLLPAVDAAGWQLTADAPTVDIPKASSPSQPVTKTGKLTLVIPSTATGSGHVRVTVRSRLNPLGLVTTSTDVLVTIGQSVVSSPDIKVSFDKTSATLDTDGKTVLVSASSGTFVGFNVAVTTTGGYTYSTKFDTDATQAHWHAAAVGAPTTLSGGASPATIPVQITVDSSSTPTSNLSFRVTSGADTTKATEVSIPVKRTA